MDINIPPIPADPQSLQPFLRNAFASLQDSFTSLDFEKKGVSSVTGVLVVPTGLRKVFNTVGSFSADPVPGAFTFSVRPSITPGDIRIAVFDSTGVLSVIAINVSWVAYGL